MKRILSLIFAMALISFFAPELSAEGRIVSDIVKNGTRIVHYQPENICATDLEIHTKDGIVTFYKSTRGCSGNSRGIAALVKGMKIDDAIARLEGIPCGNRPTSCPDQLAKALKAMKATGSKNSSR